jgi:hypothetical protein
MGMGSGFGVKAEGRDGNTILEGVGCLWGLVREVLLAEVLAM